MKDKLLIIGASGHGKVVADVAMKMKKWNYVAFLDDNPNIKTSLGLDVIGSSQDLEHYIDDFDIFVGVGDNYIRKNIYEKLEAVQATIPKLIHPSSVIGVDVKIDDGTVVMAGTVINSSTNIGKGCIVNTGATIDHDNNIADFVHISPGANLAGTVNIGKCSWIGVGSTVSNNVNIASECIVGAGGVVIKDIKEPGVYVGVPVRRI